jgi:hypothetical protein
MTIDYRAKLQHLVEKIEYTWGDIPEDVLELIDNIRTALSQPEPEVVGLGNDTIVADFRSWYNERYYRSYFGGIALVECIEWTRYALTRYATPQPMAVPVAERLNALEELARDAVSGMRYIEQSYGRLYGVGWDRVFNAADKVLPVPGAEA